MSTKEDICTGVCDKKVKQCIKHAHQVTWSFSYVIVLIQWPIIVFSFVKKCREATCSSNSFMPTYWIFFVVIRDIPNCSSLGCVLLSYDHQMSNTNTFQKYVITDFISMCNSQLGIIDCLKYGVREYMDQASESYAVIFKSVSWGWVMLTTVWICREIIGVITFVRW